MDAAPHESRSEMSELPQAMARAFDAVGLVGGALRADLARDLRSKVLMRRGLDVVEVVGAAGSGRHLCVEAAHAVARGMHGRREVMVRVDDTEELSRACEAAAGGTIVLEGFDRLAPGSRAAALKVLRQRPADTLAFALSEGRASDFRDPSLPPAVIRLKPLHEREQDLWELIDHFFAGLADEVSLGGCLGFSRQARTDLAETIRESGLESVRRVRDIVRDVVFELAADGELPVKITSEQVRPWLERNLGQTAARRTLHEASLVASQFEALAPPSELIVQLAALHGVSAEVLRDEVRVLSRVLDGIHDVPRSYRNMLGKAEDIQRAALWVLTGAQSQADFRRFFGEEGFMRPTKSVAWAFYNRVFLRDP